MKMMCENCRWWQIARVGEAKSCNNVDSDNRFDFTSENYSCNKWEIKIEQDGYATWYFD